MFQLCWSASRKEASARLWGAVSTGDCSLFREGQTSVALLHRMRILCNPVNLLYVDFFTLFLFIFRHRSCTWTFAPRWTLRGTETAAHVRYPPTAPGSPPTQRCQILHVSHPLFPKVLTHSTAGQCVQNSCIHMGSIAFNEINWKNVIFFFSPPEPLCVELTLTQAINNTTPVLIL